MAFTTGRWHLITNVEGTQCWWLVNGKMCSMPMVAKYTEDAYVCVDGHKTTAKELHERKTR
jgi:hypothetical protein